MIGFERGVRERKHSTRTENEQFRKGSGLERGARGASVSASTQQGQGKKLNSEKGQHSVLRQAHSRKNLLLRSCALSREEAKSKNPKNGQHSVLR